MEGVYDLFATGKLDPAVTQISFEQIPEGLAQLDRGEVTGRLVAMYQ